MAGGDCNLFFFDSAILLKFPKKFPKNPLPEYKIDKSKKSDEIY